jgi:NTP pyrophosphatase (non-canonical NTP hydrolase)
MLPKTDVGCENLKISEFQKMMRHIYFHSDSRRGVRGTYDWFVDEVEELGEALEGDDKGALKKEFADVLAWLASLANVADIDLEKSAISKYDCKCPKCGQSPCQCPFRMNSLSVSGPSQ